MSGRDGEGRTSEGKDGEDYLPRSLYVPKGDPRQDLRETVESILSDKFMALLSIILIPIILFPLFINFSAPELGFFEICDGTVVFFFVVEYVSKLYLAKDRWAFFKAPWHLLDLTIVAFSFAQYLPFLGLSIKGSPALLLRLLRLPRAFAVTGRVTGSRIRSEQESPALKEKASETLIKSVDSEGVHAGLMWEELSAHLSGQEQEWINIDEITEDGIGRLSRMLRVPEHHFKSTIVDEIFPHIDFVQHMTFVFLKTGEIEYPVQADSYMRISQSGLVVICSGTKVITISSHKFGLFPAVMTNLERPEGSTFVVSTLYAILEAVLQVYKSVFSEVELEVVRIGNTRRSKLPRDFLERMYQLNTEVSRLVSNLVHFRNLLNTLLSRKVALEGFDEDSKEAFSILLDEATFQNDIADDLTQNLHSLIELYINQTSFDTNRILKILAVIAGVSVIPAAISGLLGTNLLGVPYGVYLWEVVLVTGISITFVTYTFFKLGWLKT